MGHEKVKKKNRNKDKPCVDGWKSGHARCRHMCGGMVMAGVGTGKKKKRKENFT